MSSHVLLNLLNKLKNTICLLLYKSQCLNNVIYPTLINSFESLRKVRAS